MRHPSRSRPNIEVSSGLLGLLVLLFLIGLGATDAHGQCERPEQARLGAADPETIDELGYAVDIDGDVAVVTSRRSDDDGSESGSAYVFRRDGDAWTQVRKLLAPDGAAGDQFGTAAAIKGNVIVVGAMKDDAACPGDPECNSGSVYVFRHDGVAWQFETRLGAPGAAAGDQFGIAVDLSSDENGMTLLVGANDADDACPGDPGCDSGAAHVFQYDKGVWAYEAKLLASDADAGDGFGRWVTVDGDRIAVGGPANRDFGEATGSAYVYRREGATWTFEQKLLASDAEDHAFFGTSLSLSGERLLVGAWAHNGDVGNGAGAAYIFDRTGTVWTETAQLVASNATPLDNFGNGAALHGGVAVVAAWGADNGAGTASGRAYVYRFNGADWIEEAWLTPSDSVSWDQFGRPVAIDGKAVIIGAIGQDDPVSNAGAAYVFDLAPCPIDCSADIDGSGDIGFGDLLAVLSLWGPCPPGGPCLEDVDGDGEVGFTDLLAVLSTWGPCV